MPRDRNGDETPTASLGGVGSSDPHRSSAMAQVIPAPKAGHEDELHGPAAPVVGASAEGQWDRRGRGVRMSMLTSVRSAPGWSRLTRASMIRAVGPDAGRT